MDMLLISAILLIHHCEFLLWKTNGEVFLTSTKIDGNRYNLTCAADSNSTIAWIRPLKMASDIIESRTWKPRTFPYGVSYKNSSQNITETVWRQQNWNFTTSLLYNLSPVTDARWEDFPITKTNGNYSISESFTITKKSSVNFSLRLKNDSDGIITFYEMNSREPFLTVTIYLLKHKLNFTIQTNITREQQPNEIGTTDWMHFGITQHKDDVSLWHDKRFVLSCKKINNIPASFRLQSKRVAYWKLHSYSFMQGEKPNLTKVGRSFQAENYVLCFRMYIVLCNTCSMTIQLTGENDNIYFTKDYGGGNTNDENNYNWQDISITRNITKDKPKINLYILTQSDNNSENIDNLFWGMDEPRKCLQEEYRESSITVPNDQKNQVACYSLQNPSKKIQFNNNTKDHICLNEQSSYILNEIRNNYCNKTTKLCKTDTYGKVTCNCGSAGYKIDDCHTKCDDNTWGYNCEMKCGRCITLPCNAINGECRDGCRSNSIGVTCELQHSFLNKAPNLTDVKPNSVRVQFSRVHIENGKSGDAVTYKLQFKKQNDTKWNSTNNFNLDKENNEIIYDLASSTKYSFRVILYEALDSMNYYHGADLLIAETETTCNIKSSKEDFDIAPSNISVTITAKTSMDGCDNSYYKVIQLVDSKSNYINERDPRALPFIYNKLIPYNDYNVTIGNTPNDRVLIAFQTKPGAPAKVENLEVYSKTNTTISLRWKKPLTINGIIDKYKIENGENRITEEYKECTIYSDFLCAEITSLPANKQQTFEVFAKTKNTDYWGAGSQVRGLTAEEASTPPINCKLNGSKLVWIHPDKPNGPLKHFQIELTLVATEFSADLPNNSITMNTSELFGNYKKSYNFQILLNSLRPSTTYKLQLRGINSVKGKTADVHGLLIVPPPLPFIQFMLKLTQHNGTLQVEFSNSMNISRKSYMEISVTDFNVTTEKNSFKKWMICLRNKTEKMKSFPQKIIQIGQGQNCSTSKTKSADFNVPLYTNGRYNVVITMTNDYEGVENSRTFYLTYPANLTIEVEPEFNSAYLSLLILLLIPLAIGGYMFYKRSEYKCTLIENHIRCKSLSISDAEYNEELDDLNKPKPKTPKVAKELFVPAHSKDKDTSNSPIMNYAEQNITVFSKPIKKVDFDTYVKGITQSISDNGELTRQYQLLEKGQQSPWNYGIMPENKPKNRYANLMPYDANRVKLDPIAGVPHSDYINASYIDGYNLPRAYIATQGPKPGTINDFWRMVWQENVTNIVMLANVIENGKKKTEEYWPKLNESTDYGNIIVFHMGFNNYADYTYRIFKVKFNEETKTIHHLHFTSWPDHGVPTYSQSLVPFLKKILTIPPAKAPIVVHCSAGVGRTGTIILCDMCLRMLIQESQVDVLGLFQKVRTQRVNMVDNIDQYRLVHTVLLDCLAPNTTIQCDDHFKTSLDNLRENNGIRDQFDYMGETAWRDGQVGGTITTIAPENKKKNRFENIVPGNYGTIYLPRYPPSNVHSDYINAVYVDDFRIKSRFIVTQQPMPNTLDDFWRLVVEKEISIIVSLNEISQTDKTSVIFWPEKNATTTPVDYIILHQLSMVESTGFEVIKIEIQVKKGRKNSEQKQIVHILQLHNWNVKKSLPSNSNHLMSIYEEMEKLSRSENPILVTCHDGALASGIFVGMAFIIEKIKLEQQCDVCLAVRAVRRSRKQFIKDYDQFEFLYTAAALYLNQFATYSNFQS